MRFSMLPLLVFGSDSASKAILRSSKMMSLWAWRRGGEGESKRERAAFVVWWDMCALCPQGLREPLRSGKRKRDERPLTFYVKALPTPPRPAILPAGQARLPTPSILTAESSGTLVSMGWRRSKRSPERDGRLAIGGSQAQGPGSMAPLETGSRTVVT